MDIYSYLRKDHRHVSHLMDELLASKDLKRREHLFEIIRQELTLHADCEEMTFYRAIENATRSKAVQEKMEHADHEHDEIRKYLARLDSMKMSDPLWLEKFGEFKHSVAHHVEEEENEIFKKAKQYLDPHQAVQLAKDMDMLKRRMKKDMHPIAA